MQLKHLTTMDRKKVTVNIDNRSHYIEKFDNQSYPMTNLIIVYQ